MDNRVLAGAEIIELVEAVFVGLCLFQQVAFGIKQLQRNTSNTFVIRIRRIQAVSIRSANRNKAADFRRRDFAEIVLHAIVACVEIDLSQHIVGPGTNCFSIDVTN